MANEERLRELVTKLREVNRLQDDAFYTGIRWNQDRWYVKDECGTEMCSAGWVVQMDADRRKIANPWVENLGVLHATPEEIEAGKSWTCMNPETAEDMHVVTAKERAIRILELSQEEADMLFYATTDVDEIGQIVEDIIAGRHR